MYDGTAQVSFAASDLMIGAQAALRIKHASIKNLVAELSAAADEGDDEALVEELAAALAVMESTTGEEELGAVLAAAVILREIGQRKASALGLG